MKIAVKWARFRLENVRGNKGKKGTESKMLVEKNVAREKEKLYKNWLENFWESFQFNVYLIWFSVIEGL